MSQRYARMQKREARREMKQYLVAFKDYLRAKPKWCPWWFWGWMQEQVLHMERIDPTHKDRAKIKS